jgi:hypothetical protein
MFVEYLDNSNMTSVNPMHNALVELSPPGPSPLVPPLLGFFFFVIGFLTAVGSA